MSALLAYAMLSNHAEAGSRDKRTTESEQQQQAFFEIQASQIPAKRPVSGLEATRITQIIYGRMEQSAKDTCERMQDGGCKWAVFVSESEEFNAYATGRNEVVLHRGVFELTRNEDELAFVLAHELGHHIADHIDETSGRAAAGAVLAAIIGGAVAAQAYNQNSIYYQQNVIEAANTSAQIGAVVAAQSFSVAQEKEADGLAATILSGAGYDLGRARGVMLTLGKMNGELFTQFLASHPAGPDRLTALDLFILADNLGVTSSTDRASAFDLARLAGDVAGPKEIVEDALSLREFLAAAAPEPGMDAKHAVTAQGVSKTNLCSRRIELVAKKADREVFKTRCADQRDLYIDCQTTVKELNDVRCVALSQ